MTAAVKAKSGIKAKPKAKSEVKPKAKPAANAAAKPAPEPPAAKKAAERVFPAMIPVDAIDPSPLNKRAQRNIDILAEDIKERGLLQPIVVRPVAAGRHEIVCGERRWRACKYLGHAHIPAIVSDRDERDAHADRLMENIQREDLDPLEEGDGVRALLDMHGGDAEEVAARCRFPVAWVKRRARLPNLTAAWRVELASEDTNHPHIRDKVTLMEEVAILPPATQDALLREGRLRHALTAKDMRDAIAKHFRRLDAGPWMNDGPEAAFFPERQCSTCLKRTDRDGDLFAGMDGGGADGQPHCLDSACWDGKMLEWCGALLLGERKTDYKAVAICDGWFPVHKTDVVKDAIGEEPLANYMWREKVDGGTIPDGYGERRAVFFLGPLAGTAATVWVDEREEEDDDEDEERAYRARARKDAERTRQKRFERAGAAAMAFIPEAVPEGMTVEDMLELTLMTIAEERYAREEGENVLDAAWEIIRDDAAPFLRNRLICALEGREGGWPLNTVCAVLHIDRDKLMAMAGEKTHEDGDADE